MTEEIGSNVAITFANIRRMAIGMDFGNPCMHAAVSMMLQLLILSLVVILFELLTPPMLERERFNRTKTGEDWKDQNTAPMSTLKRERSPDDDGGNETSRQVCFICEVQ